MPPSRSMRRRSTVKPLLLQSLGDVAGGHGAVERVGLADPLRDLEAQPRELVGDRLGAALALLGVRGVDLGALLLEELHVGRRRLEGEALRQQVVAAVARLDLDHLAPLAEVPLVAEQNDFHASAS